MEKKPLKRAVIFRSTQQTDLDTFVVENNKTRLGRGGFTDFRLLSRIIARRHYGLGKFVKFQY